MAFAFGIQSFFYVFNDNIDMEIWENICQMPEAIIKRG